MSECEHCGEVVGWKNAAGHYRDVCEDCATEVAGDRRRHTDRCEADECSICDLVDRYTATESTGQE
jgi:hypothetical protein